MEPQLTLVGGKTANKDVPGEPFKSLLIRLGQDWLLSHRAALEKNNTIERHQLYMLKNIRSNILNKKKCGSLFLFYSKI